jgi:hypothetical protein
MTPMTTMLGESRVHALRGWAAASSWRRCPHGDATLRSRFCPACFLVPMSGRRIGVSIADFERAQRRVNCTAAPTATFRAREWASSREGSSTLSFAMVGGSLTLPPVVIPVPVCRNDVRVPVEGSNNPGDLCNRRGIVNPRFDLRSSPDRSDARLAARTVASQLMSTRTLPTAPPSTASCASAVRSSGKRWSGSPTCSPTPSAPSATATATSATARSFAAAGTV